MDWPKLMQMNWGYVPWLKSGQDVEDANREIRKAIDRNPPDNDELCEVIRWLAGPENTQSKCPTLRELIIGVFVTRKKSRVAHRGYSDTDAEFTLAKLKSDIRNATPEKRWDIACSATCNEDNDQVTELLRWCRDNNLDVLRPVYPQDCHTSLLNDECLTDPDGNPRCDVCDRVKWQKC